VASVSQTMVKVKVQAIRLAMRKAGMTSGGQLIRAVRGAHGGPGRSAIYGLLADDGYVCSIDNARKIADTLNVPVGKVFVHANGDKLSS